jgi:hypothetical protein
MCARVARVLRWYRRVNGGPQEDFLREMGRVCGEVVRMLWGFEGRGERGVGFTVVWWYRWRDGSERPESCVPLEWIMN